MLIYKGAARRLKDKDIPRIGKLIGVGEDEVHAIMEVESSGGGYDSQGRVKALYEPHLAYRYSSGSVRDKLVRANLAYPKWGERPYPKDSYPRILMAAEIDETVAIKATSWGLGQILGANFKAAGYSTPQAMVSAFAESESYQLQGMINFIKANGLADEVKRHDWAGLAKGYNGPGYAKNHYDTKLAAAFRKWQAIPDTAWSPDEPDAAPSTPPTSPPALEPTTEPAPPAPATQPPATGLGGLIGLVASLFTTKNKET